MATVTFTNFLADNPGLEDVLDPNGTIGTHDATTYEIINNDGGAWNGYVFRLTGTGFTYGGDGITATGGTIAGIEVLDGSGNLVATATIDSSYNSLGNFQSNLVGGVFYAFESLFASNNTHTGSASNDRLTDLGPSSGTNGAVFTLSGEAGNDVLWHRSNNATTTLVGGVGDDVIRISQTYGTISVHGSAQDGSGGVGETDTLDLAMINQGFDPTAITNIDALVFSAASGDTILSLSSDQIGTGLVSETLAVTGRASNPADFITIVRPDAVSAVNLNLSGWTFLSWGGTHQHVVITLSDSANLSDQVIGTSVSDQIYTGAGSDTVHGGGGADFLAGEDGEDTIRGGGGADTLIGGEGDDTFVYETGEVSTGEFVNGENGTDTVRADTDTDFSGVIIYGVERVVFNGAANLTFSQSLAGQAFTFVGDAGADAVNIVLTTGSTFNASDISLTSWDAEDSFSIAGSSGNDTIVLPNFFAAIDGLGGNDLIQGGTAADDIFGGDGNDDLRGGADADTLHGGADNDTLSGQAGADDLRGDAGADTLSGGTEADTLRGGAGADTLNGNDGDDLLIYAAGEAAAGEAANGGNGTDTIRADADSDFSGFSFSSIEHIAFNGAASLTFNQTASGLSFNFVGDAGADTVSVVLTTGSTFNAGGISLTSWNAGDSISITGSSGNDSITLPNFFVTIDGLGGNDFIQGGTAADDIFGGIGIDELRGGSNADTLHGGGDSDTLYGEAGEDDLRGDVGVDQLYGGIGSDLLSGGTDNDTLNGESGADTLTGDAGDDQLYGGTENDTLSGGTDNDTLYGDSGADTLNGDAGEDQLYGGDDADTLRGGAGADALAGDDGDDLLIYAAGDITTGESANGGNGTDTIRADANLDFTGVSFSSIERIVFNGAASLTFNQTASGHSFNFVGDAGADAVNIVLTTGSTFNASGISLTSWNAGDTFSITASSGDDSITLPTFFVAIDGLGGNDLIQGAAAADDIFGGLGSDELRGGGNADTLHGGADNDLLIGEAGEDDLRGDAGVDQLNGGDDADTLRGGAGADSLFGEEGNDLLIYAAGDSAVGETADGGNGTDTIRADANLDFTGVSFSSIERIAFNGAASLTFNQTASGHSFNFVGDAGADAVNIVLTTGSTFNASGISLTSWNAGDTFSITASSGDDNITLPTFFVAVDGLGGNDFIQGAAAADDIFGGIGNDDLRGGSNADTLHGGGDNDSLYGEVGVDDLRGDNGVDQLYGGDDADTLRGGAGADYLSGDEGDDLLLYAAGDGAAGETASGGNGIDTIRADASLDFTGVSFSSIERIVFNGATNLTFSDTAHGQVFAFVGNAAANHVAVNVATGVSMDGWTFQSWTTGSDTVSVIGNGSDNEARFWSDTAIRFTYNGGGGNDIIRLDYSATATAWTFDFRTPGVQQTLANGSTIINVEGADLNLGSGNDVFFGGVGANYILAGSGADTLTGGAQTDNLHGGSANDTIDGRGGIDHLFGDEGDDSLFSRQGEGGDNIDGGGGIDFALIDRSTGTRSLNMDIGDPTIGFDIGDGTFIVAIERVEFRAGSGNDQLTGGLLVDILSGGAGRDLIDGGAGNDQINGGDGTDILDGGAGNDTINGGAGIDIIDGGAGNDTLDGGSEADTIEGGTGDDFVGGGAGADNLSGGAGNDTINGGAGIDLMEGGTGNDVFIVDHIRDAINEGLNEGTDTVQSSISLVLDDNLERLTLLNVATALNGTGNGLANIITGNDFANVLDGGVDSVVDTLIGGLGGDTYVLGASTNDIVTEATGNTGGIDTVTSTASRVLSGGLANIENLTLLGGTVAINGIGNGLVNIITGNEGINVLDGGLLGDTLNGNGGNDVFLYASQAAFTGDTVNGGAGTDTIRFTSLSTNATLTLSNLVTLVEVAAISDAAGFATGTTQLNLNALAVTSGLQLIGNNGINTIQGTNFNDTISGNAGNDTLLGNGGTDTIIGGAGQDTMTGGLLNDVFRFTAVADSPTLALADVITDFDDSGDDTIDVGALFDPAMTFINSAAFTAAGQVRINDIAGADVLVEVNTSGTSGAEFVLRLTNTTLASMTGSDFVL